MTTGRKGNMGLIVGMLAVAVVLVFIMGRGAGEHAVDPASANALIAAEKELQLVDVRTPEEYVGGHLAGAKNIPLDALEGRLGEISKDKPLLLYCHSGRRSGLALRLVRSKGYDQAQHIRGGIAAWQAAGFPVVR